MWRSLQRCGVGWGLQNKAPVDQRAEAPPRPRIERDFVPVCSAFPTFRVAAARRTYVKLYLVGRVGPIGVGTGWLER
eukprot:6464604-Prymnesium_polylepis.1